MNEIIKQLQEEFGPFMDLGYGDRVYLYDMNTHILVHDNGIVESWENYIGAPIYRLKEDHWEEVDTYVWMRR